MSKTKDPDRNMGGAYEIGYGKPPKHTRFTPGRSGNPKGRPKGVRNFSTDVKAMLKARVKVTLGGKPRKVSTQQAMLLRLTEKALGGDARALDRMSQLAQMHNNEEMIAPAASLDADDAMVFEVFKARVLSGAAQSGLCAEASGSSEGGAESTDLGAPDNSVEPEGAQPNAAEHFDSAPTQALAEGKGGAS
jgi:hypothetical protein